MHNDRVSVVRSFNRTYTARIGALQDSFLGSGLPLGTARLLYEIGVRPAATTQDLRRRLGLDSGYLSRLLRRLETEELVRVSPDPVDRRRRLVDLTDSGCRAWQRLEARSQTQASTLLDPLSERQQARLVEALTTADLLVRAATLEFQTVDVDDPTALTAIQHYFAELQRRFPGGFDARAEATKDQQTLRPPHGVVVVAVSDGEPVACGGVRRLEDQVAEVKRMWVDPGWRGAGLGSRLLQQLEATAVDLGHRTLRLDTNDALTEAIALYQRAGYREIDSYLDSAGRENPYASRWFEKDLTGSRVAGPQPERS